MGMHNDKKYGKSLNVNHLIYMQNYSKYCAIPIPRTYMARYNADVNNVAAPMKMT